VGGRGSQKPARKKNLLSLRLFQLRFGWLANRRRNSSKILNRAIVAANQALKSDWHYLFAATGKGLVSRELGEAIASFDSPLLPKLGWLVFLGRNSASGKKQSFRLPGPACFAWDAVCCWEFSVARRRSLHGFFTSAPLRAGIARLRRGQFHDNGTLLFDVVAAARAILA
jgi:hypothetical protein